MHDGFEGPLIHTFNKGRTSHLNKEYFTRTAKRKNVLLMGDTLGDLEMGNNLDSDKYNIVKIGFLNDKVENFNLTLQLFKEHSSCLIAHLFFASIYCVCSVNVKHRCNILVELVLFVICD